MSASEKQRKILWMQEFEKEMLAKGKKPSKMWQAAKNSIGAITIYDPAYML